MHYQHTVCGVTKTLSDYVGACSFMFSLARPRSFISATRSRTRATRSGPPSQTRSSRKNSTNTSAACHSSVCDVASSPAYCQRQVPPCLAVCICWTGGAARQRTHANTRAPSYSTRVLLTFPLTRGLLTFFEIFEGVRTRWMRPVRGLISKPHPLTQPPSPLLADGIGHV